MQGECISFSAIPHTAELFSDFLYNFDKVRRFYPRPPQARDWAAEEARRLKYDPERRERVAAVLERQNRAWGASPETLENIARLRAGASVIVTGQQVGLFGGPLFSIYKAITAIKLAAELSQAGVETVPVFWLATEDHDLDEVNHVTLLGPDGSLREFRTEAKSVDGAPVEHVRFGPEISSLVEQAAEFLADGDASKFLRESYRPGETLGSAFAKLMSRIFSHSGVVLLDPSDPELHQIASSVYRAAAMAASELDEALLERNKALEAAGYHAQVHVTGESTLLFAMRDGARTPVHRANGEFTIGEEKVGAAELLQRIAARPEDFSANVLLRPVVQDYLLPTIAYVGGPAEVAYFAQAAVVYEELLGRVTPVLPRFAATLVEPKIKRLLERYQIAVADAFHGEEQLRVELGEHALPADVNASFDQAARALDESLARIDSSLEKLDKTLVEAAGTAASKMRYQLDRLRERAARALLRRSEDQARHAEDLLNSLFPNKNLQEREIGGMAYVARHGTGLLLKLYDAAQTGCPEHQVVWL